MAEQVVVFHPGTQHSWQTARAMQELGRLEYYATSIFYQPDRWPYRIERYLPPRLAARAHAEFRRFSGPAIDPARVKTAGMAEWLERFAHRAGFKQLSRTIDRMGNRQFATGLEKSLRSDAPFALWGYNNSSLEAFRVAREHGRLCILDRTIGHGRAFNQVMAEVYAQYPEFFAASDFQVAEARIEREDEEHALADVIVVGAPYVADTVRQHARVPGVAERLHVLNYCYDEASFPLARADARSSDSGPLKFLFVGRVSARKGVHLLLNVFSRIPASAATLTIVGTMDMPRETFDRHAERITYRPTVARQDVGPLMRDHDVFVFPSYFEGSAIVLYEAMASGMAIIQSVNAGVAADDESGIVLDAITEDALYDAVMQAIDDRQRVAAWRDAALQKASNYNFTAYKGRIDALMRSLEAR